MPFHAVRSIAFRAWEAVALEDVMSTGTGFFIFRFRDEDAVLVWARLHGLPYPLWSHKGLCMVSSMLGQPLSSDKTTSKRTRLDYARIIVEYEWTPKRFLKCCVFGHVCHQLEPTTTDPIRERKQKRDVPIPARVSVLSTIRDMDASLALVSYQQTVRASRGEFSGSESGFPSLVLHSDDLQAPDATLSGSVSLPPLEITCRVTHVFEGFSFGITFVYGSNDPRNRRNLWDFLRDQSVEFDSMGLLWLVLGDFNAILGASDKVGDDPPWYGYTDDFGQCIHNAELIGVPFTRLRYTWHNSQRGDGIILRKLDWVFASPSWFPYRPNIVLEFRPWDVSNHSSMVVWFGPHHGKAVWDKPIVGNPMFRLTQKLGLLKWKLKSLHIRVSSHISSQITEASRYFFGCISPDMISPLTAHITDDEIRIALFSIPDDKAPSLNKYTSLFFKRAWDIISIDIRDAVRHFFTTNEMPRCVNATRTALAPKVESRSRMTDFRPISCCNVFYKCMPKELLQNYHLGGTSPRCVLKVDIRKAFDTVNWDFILSGLRTVGFPERMVYWSSKFLLPAATVRQIESILASFLWMGTSLSPSSAKVAWSSVCYPLREDGLGIKRIQDWNRAAILKHVWRLLNDRSSVWSSWARLVLLHGQSFWHIRVTSGASWAWRKILLSKVWCQGLIVTCIGDGRDTMLWRDYWLP
ncbi:uncharacterized protein LOC116123775 [Pistacia vera]|uniref:uncharacterized protein LOC116123775 n=1 Tax=Pistacia vera TaxID=55513 RepID=UPI001262BF4F|nr:uncharacterized protein LOC116123775 [Pistacia vera]